MGYQYHKSITVVMLTTVGYDYGELWILFLDDVPTFTMSVLKFSDEV
jgi:hypothetical protein